MKAEWERGSVRDERVGSGGGDGVVAPTGFRTIVWVDLITAVGAELCASLALCSTGTFRFRPSHPLLVVGLSDAEVRAENVLLDFLERWWWISERKLGARERRIERISALRLCSGEKVSQIFSS